MRLHGYGLQRRGRWHGLSRRSHKLLDCFGRHRLFRGIGRKDGRQRLWRRRDSDVLNDQRLQIFVLRRRHPGRHGYHSPQYRQVHEHHPCGSAKPVRTTAQRIVQAEACQGANTSAPSTATRDKPWRRVLART